ncbi:MAG: rRNA maturation RNase YbeY [Methylococcaceae bacterium]|jgi:probable rRNA maturation factor|nr:rRNA maturation RNase YbeY [Methylococcaceae bacterium]MDZ4156512.1 rRNA maturation RNase YbeY [Methylococcales bacterium]MDP2393033.1 rRNA maturation RNase YbeY [Methylococcaceae bacterium]MDP3019177.1 rRNA maturation RNase YbeY [Methylococcaceae bacterium]MDP3389639.1 rRNA maturation RNase YbeY [Methylococcaceae bacterium]
MNQLEIQDVFHSEGQPTKEQFQSWVDAALADYRKDAELVIRIVDEQQSAELNQQYRHKQGPTNILSFPIELPDGVELDLLGDLVVCAPVLEREALQQHKALIDHWAHIIVHGVLHLLGYDHIDDSDAEQMEALEIAILNTLNIKNPYTEVTEV